MEILHIPKSVLQMNTIFISILIEALPFILIGVFVSGLIQMFVTEDMIARMMPKNRFLSVMLAVVLGMLFPGCECGIVPIVRRLIGKGVPSYAGIAFMLTGPIINPVVLFATYVAFGNSIKMVMYRAVVAIIVAIVVGLVLSFFVREQPLKHTYISSHNHVHSFKEKLWEVCTHAVEEFFSMGKYLVLGALIAAGVQTYVKTATLLSIGQGPLASAAVMMGLAFILSLCSEADAFIASSFQSTFSTASLVAFLVFGPMVDIKNTLMMLGTFKTRFVILVITLVIVTVYVSSLVLYFVG
jgi:uncharacterized membrane protein YraQ (UPF0718 family)